MTIVNQSSGFLCKNCVMYYETSQFKDHLNICKNTLVMKKYLYQSKFSENEHVSIQKQGQGSYQKQKCYSSKIQDLDSQLMDYQRLNKSLIISRDIFLIEEAMRSKSVNKKDDRISRGNKTIKNTIQNAKDNYLNSHQLQEQNLSQQLNISTINHSNQLINNHSFSNNIFDQKENILLYQSKDSRNNNQISTQTPPKLICQLNMLSATSNQINDTSQNSYLPTQNSQNSHHSHFTKTVHTQEQEECQQRHHFEQQSSSQTQQKISNSNNNTRLSYVEENHSVSQNNEQTNLRKNIFDMNVLNDAQKTKKIQTEPNFQQERSLFNVETFSPISQKDLEDTESENQASSNLFNSEHSWSLSHSPELEEKQKKPNNIQNQIKPELQFKKGNYINNENKLQQLKINVNSSLLKQGKENILPDTSTSTSKSLKIEINERLKNQKKIPTFSSTIKKPFIRKSIDSGN